MTRLERIYELIEIHNLRDKSRVSQMLYKRHFVFAELQQAGLTLTKIGQLFGKNHATVINGIKVHKNMLSYQDREYLNIIAPLVEYLSGYEHAPVEYKYARREKDELKEDILAVNNMHSLRRLKRWINQGYYEKNN